MMDYGRIKKNRMLFCIFSLMAAVTLAGSVIIPATSSGVGDMLETEESIEVSNEEKRSHILVMGCDRASGLTDVMMLVSVDRERSAVSIMQIPRDTYAAYTDRSYKKLNGAYGIIGAEELCRFISDSFSLRVDKYLVLSPDALVSLVDAVGGVEINIERDMYYKDPAQGLVISFKAGEHILDGKRAEEFIRYRSGYSDGDLGRIDAQKKFLCGLFLRVREKCDLVTAVRIASELIGRTDTNISVGEGRELAEAILGIGTENIFIMTAPGEPVVATSSGASYYSLSKSAMDDILCEYFGAESSPFDKKELFRNKNYKEFCSAYDRYIECRVYSAKNIIEGK